MTITLDLGGLTKNETARVLSYLPALHPASVVRTPTVLGGKRFRVVVQGLTPKEASEVTAHLAGYLRAVSLGQAN